MFQAPCHLKRSAVVVASLNRQRTLTHCGAENTGIENFGDAMLPTQAPQSRRSQHDRVVAAFIQFAQARVDIAANIFDLQIRTASPKLRRPAKRSGAHASARAEVLQGSANERIARVLTLGNGCQGETSR